ncbi:hypothetical protein [Streptomyces luteireticuli]|uniref:Uncharacterized protein n=1 Tax=Streptomyces luteireticuli TaxID=173858 RepID=A0ABN0YUA1_9ACTN
MSETVNPYGFPGGAGPRRINCGRINRVTAEQYVTESHLRSLPHSAGAERGKAGQNPGSINPFQQSRVFEIPAPGIPVPEIEHEKIPA